MIKTAEDRYFLEGQRMNRMMKMNGIDTKLAQLKERVSQRRKAHEYRKQREEARKH